MDVCARLWRWFTDSDLKTPYIIAIQWLVLLEIQSDTESSTFIPVTEPWIQQR